MRIPFRPSSLIFKVILVTSVILILVISFNVWWNTRLHEASIERMTLEKTKIVSESIENNILRAMEKGGHFDINRILQGFAVYKGIWKISIFKSDGTVMFSTDQEEMGKRIGEVEYYLRNQYFIREATVGGADGKRQRERVYYYNKAIQNGSECHRCHQPEERIIGVLTVANSLKEMDETVSAVKVHSIIFAVITLTFSSAVLGILFLKFVELPIRKLTYTMRRVEEGDFESRVGLKGRDEMGRLGESLNLMIKSLQTTKREAEKYHQELVQRADRMATLGELASGMAHEIRNPLAGIQGAIQILAEGLPSEDNRRPITDEIQKQITKLEKLVKGLLSYAKPVPANYLPTDVNELVDKVISFFLTHGGWTEKLKIDPRYDSSIPKIKVDPGSMEQAFLNIVLNAQKAMSNGGTLTVTTRLLRNSNEKENGHQEAQIIFEDTGVGIREENLSKIFNPFFSTRSDGTGLGLSITKKIVEQHEGRIEVESRLNVGTRFTITLPVMN
jgi:signal transduction histidine kinase